MFSEQKFPLLISSVSDPAEGWYSIPSPSLCSCHVSNVDGD